MGCLALSAIIVFFIGLFGGAAASSSYSYYYGYSAGVGAATAGLGIFTAFLMLIPLAWMIPMTVVLAKKRKNGEKPSVALGVCTLLFVNLISGILILVDHSED